MSTPDPDHDRSLAARCRAFFALSAAGSIGFIVAYLLDAGPVTLAATAGCAIAMLGIGMLALGTATSAPVRQPPDSDHPSPATRAADREIQDSWERGTAIVGRRSFLNSFTTAAGALGVAAAFPLASMGPRPGKSLRTTPWTAGTLLVREDGSAVLASDITVGTMLTVFPEHARQSADAQVVLLRLEPSALQGRRADAKAADGMVAFSRLCTHAGCPVAQYDQDQMRLLCPCHQSLFDVRDGAEPVFGPAPRPLPQLPLTVDEHGEVRAADSFDEPVGPAFWSFPS
jgi:ubiquinol-cytochrome c reductase iron-sulfur subunit